MSSSVVRRGAADAVRLLLRHELRRQAWRTLGDVDLIYERQATFQDLGRPFQRRGSWWIVESNGPFWYEAGTERKSLALVSLARRLEIAAYRHADLVVAVSDALKEIIVEESEVEADHVYVLPNATDRARFDPMRARPRRFSPGRVIGWVGYMTEWAGVDNLLRAAAILRDSRRDVEIVLVGDGPDRARLESIAFDERIEDRVHFVGHVGWEEVPDLMAGFDIAYSGQRPMSIGAMYHSPQKLYEYQAMGLPLIASAYPDARRLIGDPGAGWLFAPNDLSGLSRCLGEALEADDLRKRGERGQANVWKHHTWDARIRTLLAELDDRGMLRRRTGG